MSPTLRGAAYGTAAAAIWGGLYVVSDVVLKTIPPFTLLTIRLILGVLVLLPFVLRVRPFPTRREIAQVIGVGILGFGVSVGAQFVGTDQSTAVNGTLVTSSAPAFIVLFAALILREKLTVRRISAVLLATLGVIVIIDPANANFSSSTFQGDLVLAVAAVTWGLYSVLVRRISTRIDTLVVTFFAFLGGLILTIPAAMIELPQRPVGDIDLPTILGVLYLGIVSTALAMWLWNRAFALVDASTASLFFFAQPLVGTILSVALLNQQMTLNLWVGSALIGIGVLLAITRARRQTSVALQSEMGNESNNVTSNESQRESSSESGRLAV